MALATNEDEAIKPAAIEAGATKPAETETGAAKPAEGDAEAAKPEPVVGEALKPVENEQLFLDRLSQAESGGRQYAKNPRSSALGPFQFIHATFFDVVTRNFPEIAEGKSRAEISKLRVDPHVARNAARAYTRENAAFLEANGLTPDAGALRLAFLVGPNAAVDLLSAEPSASVASVLGKAAVGANPFMARMTAEQLIERAKREAEGIRPLRGRGARKGAAALPAVKYRCAISRPSCQKWVALAKQRATRKVAGD
ncbi:MULTISPECIES: hypothetical protein [Rhodomicrobium]|uniref:hypothetical protein n=1 Tax=Rhodomicrobium TaxID=1068 RepID=UPI000F7477D9|nr:MULTISPECIES: hypothetical protein [Rhodomicrobium]